MDFSTYLHAVGTGRKGNRDLSFDEAKDMMKQMLAQEATAPQVAAFLLGWRLKPETTEEFCGALECCDEFVSHSHVENSIELGYPFDGKRRNPYLFPLVARYLSPFGVKLVVVGDKLQPAKGGITTKEVYSNVETDKNLRFFDRKEYCYAMHKLTEVRNSLGLRTALNTIEKLPNVAQSKVALTGVFHKPYVKKYIEIFAKRYETFGVIQGNEGTPEVFSKSRVWVAKNGKVQEYMVEPRDFGVEYKKSWEDILLEESIEQLVNPTKEFVQLAKFNAALYLFVAGVTNSLESGLEQIG